MAALLRASKSVCAHTCSGDRRRWLLMLAAAAAASGWAAVVAGVGAASQRARVLMKLLVEWLTGEHAFFTAENPTAYSLH